MRIKDNDCDGIIDENNVCSTPTPPSQNTTCYSSVQNIPATCAGGSITSDSYNGCRTIICANGVDNMKIFSCDKPDGSIPQYFEMYLKNKAGSLVSDICIGSTCLKGKGYEKSGNYPICTGSGGTGGTANLPPNAPTWLEPSAGKSDVDVTDFHIHVFPMTDAENDTHVATDFEMWDDAVNERVWSSLYNTQILTHIHNADGMFEGNLAGQNMLKFNQLYRLRARFYEKAPANNVSAWSEWRFFRTRSQFTNTSTSSSLVPTPSGWAVRNGYGVQLVAQGVSVPVNLAIAPELYNHLPSGQQPLLYFTQLYGQVGMIRKDGSYVQFANNLLNYQSFGSLPGSGETGVDGIYVDPTTGDLFVSLVYNDNSAPSGYYGKVVRFFTNGNGDGYTGTATILSGIPVSPSHHVHQITRGPDGKLYMSVGDADDPFNAKNPGVMSGKILRFNDDGSNPGGNPWGTLAWAAGFRNAFGTAWRPGTNELFATNNGPDSDDGVYRVTAGNTFGWCCDTAAGTWHLWPQTTAPVAAAFDSGSSGFPGDSTGSLYVGLSGSTYSKGPQPIAKRIVQFRLNLDGSKQSVSDFLVYNGSGFSAPIGLAFGPDGLYFTDIYGETGFTGAGQTSGNIYKVVFGGSNSLPPGSTAFSAALGPGRWYPKGLEMVWECKQSNGIGPFKYDFVFGDGMQQTNMDSFSTYHKYPAPGTYTASCAIRDLANGKTASTTTTITLQECTSSDFQCN
ncbi:PQQ-dependent sugar dehydrogenase [Candidatus Woesearchaeota archaeon]|nr:PQQ-dependent sugar dehydrogenase [Candidatus Woesearchaeota archaeon]